jgi:hypothetical protein
MTESQKAFEAWALPKGYSMQHNNSEYASLITTYAFNAWEASRKQALEGLMHFISTEIVVSGCNVADEIVGVIKDIQDGK